MDNDTISPVIGGDDLYVLIWEKFQGGKIEQFCVGEMWYNGVAHEVWL